MEVGIERNPWIQSVFVLEKVCIFKFEFLEPIRSNFSQTRGTIQTQ